MSPTELKRYRPEKCFALVGVLFGVAGMQMPIGPSHSLTTGPRLKRTSMTTADVPFDDKVEGGLVGDSRADRHAI
jgi:hypothetical protein